MRYTYFITLEVSVGDLFSEVKGIETSVNTVMSGFGFDEKMVITNHLPFTLTTARKLTGEEKEKISAIALDEFSKKFKHCKLVSFEPNDPIGEEE